MGVIDPSGSVDDADTPNDLEDKQDVEDLVEAISRMFNNVLHIAEDLTRLIPAPSKYWLPYVCCTQVTSVVVRTYFTMRKAWCP